MAGQSIAVVAAVEAGGTSFKVAVCTVLLDESGNVSSSSFQPPEIIHRTEVDSSHDDPGRTLDECCAFFLEHKPKDGYSALGLATFGPVGVRPDRTKEYGRILKSSPKASWRDVDLLGPLKKTCQGATPMAVKVETDVNAPALAEYLKVSAERTITSVAYITVGTGVGVGLIVNDKTVHGRMHPEGGHVPIHPLPNDTFSGYSWGDRSPFRGQNTVEGVACSVALTERLDQITGKKSLSRSVLADLPDDHEIWDHAANALASLCTTLLLTLSIELIVLGGGIVQRRGLLDKIRSRTVECLNGYLELPADMSTLIKMASFGKDSGLVGATILAHDAMLDDDKCTRAREKKMKQEAFGYGLRHGFLVGVLSAALIFRYGLMGRRAR